MYTSCRGWVLAMLGKIITNHSQIQTNHFFLICHDLLKICFDFLPHAATFCGDMNVGNNVSIADASTIVCDADGSCGNHT